MVTVGERRGPTRRRSATVGNLAFASGRKQRRTAASVASHRPGRPRPPAKREAESPWQASGKSRISSRKSVLGDAARCGEGPSGNEANEPRSTSLTSLRRLPSPRFSPYPSPIPRCRRAPSPWHAVLASTGFARSCRLRPIREVVGRRRPSARRFRVGNGPTRRDSRRPRWRRRQNPDP
jgi:hypothetical protein